MPATPFHTRMGLVVTTNEPDFIDTEIPMSDKRISRNDPCPCGSGKKYKKCCYHKDRGSSETEFPIGTVARHCHHDKWTTTIPAGMRIAHCA